MIDDARGDLDLTHPDAVDSPLQACEHGAFRRPLGKQVDDMHSARLSDAIDATDALLEAYRIPRQLQIDDKPACPVKVQPFRACIGGDQYVRGASGKRTHRLLSFA